MTSVCWPTLIALSRMRKRARSRRCALPVRVERLEDRYPDGRLPLAGAMGPCRTEGAGAEGPVEGLRTVDCGRGPRRPWVMELPRRPERRFAR